MSAVDVNIYTLQSFSLASARAGVTLFAKNNTTNLYYPVTAFSEDSPDVLFPYKAIIETQEFYFNASGSTVEGLFTLYIAPGTSNTPSDSGTIVDDVYTETDPVTEEPVRYNLKKTNYRETVALEVLNALTEYAKGFEEYTPAKIKLLNHKSLEFANEFIHWAIQERRALNANENPDEEQAEGFYSEKYFVDVLDDENNLIGAKALYDLYIMQDTTENEEWTDQQIIANRKNISEILRHVFLEEQEVQNDDPYQYIRFDKGIISAGFITAGAVGPTDSLSNQILYRLDTWDGYNDLDYADWVPAAKIVNDRLTTAETAINALNTAMSLITDGSGEGVLWGTLSIIGLTVPLGFVVANSPLTENGTFAISYDTEHGYSAIPTTQQMKLFSALAVHETTNDGATVIDRVDSSVPIQVTGDVRASGNVVAGGVSPGSELSQQILYRLDDWDDYTSAKAGWVPAASIIDERFTGIESDLNTLSGIVDNIIEEGVGGGEGTLSEITISVPTGFATNPADGVIDADGPFAIVFAEGYSAIPTTQQMKLFSALAVHETTSNNVTTVDRVDSSVSLQVTGDVRASRNVVAGGVSPGSELSQQILYRLDSWSGYSDASKGDWVASASLVNGLRDSINTINGSIATLLGRTQVIVYVGNKPSPIISGALYVKVSTL